MHSYTEVETTGFGGKIGSAIAGIFFGLVFLGLGIGLIYINEGTKNPAKIAAKSKPLSSEVRSLEKYETNFVSVTGPVTTREEIGDGRYLRKGKYIALRRTSEMYSWTETSRTKTRDNVGGSTTRETTYTYSTDWREHPEASSSFKRPEGHYNPEKSIKSVGRRVESAKIRDFPLEMQTLKLKHYSPIPLTEENVRLRDGAQLVAEKNCLFVGKGSLESPEVGDIRIIFSAVRPVEKGTVFALVEKGKLVPYVTEEVLQSHPLGPIGKFFADDGDSNTTRDLASLSFYRLFEGGRDAAIKKLADEAKMWKWILRGVGFLMIWIALAMFFQPLVAILSILPFAAKVGKFLIGVLTFIVAIPIALIAIVVSMVVQNIIAVLIAVGIGVVVLIIALVASKGMLQRKAQA